MILSRYALTTSRVLTAVANSDFSLQIYDDVLQRKLFHKIPTYKPSSLNVLDVDGSQSFLVFLENEQSIKMYQYKGTNHSVISRPQLVALAEVMSLFTWLTVLLGRKFSLSGCFESEIRGSCCRSEPKP